MYFSLLVIHSWFRWLILLCLVVLLIRSYQGWLKDKAYLKFDRVLSIVTLVGLYIQLVFGLTLYFQSPMVKYFLTHFKESIHQTEFRFFGMEHITSMLLAILFVTIGVLKSIYIKSDFKKFKILAIWVTMAFIIIFLSIPWSFSPFTSRPDFRWIGMLT